MVINNWAKQDHFSSKIRNVQYPFVRFVCDTGQMAFINVFFLEELSKTKKKWGVGQLVDVISKDSRAKFRFSRFSGVLSDVMPKMTSWWCYDDVGSIICILLHEWSQSVERFFPAPRPHPTPPPPHLSAIAQGRIYVFVFRPSKIDYQVSVTAHI